MLKLAARHKGELPCGIAITGYSDREGYVIGTGHDIHVLFLYVLGKTLQPAGKKVDKSRKYNTI